jgi:hypothetical protein
MAHVWPPPTAMALRVPLCVGTDALRTRRAQEPHLVEPALGAGTLDHARQRMATGALPLPPGISGEGAAVADAAICTVKLTHLSVAGKPQRFVPKNTQGELTAPGAVNSPPNGMTRPAVASYRRLAPGNHLPCILGRMKRTCRQPRSPGSCAARQPRSPAAAEPGSRRAPAAAARARQTAARARQTAARARQTAARARQTARHRPPP